MVFNCAGAFYIAQMGFRTGWTLDLGLGHTDGCLAGIESRHRQQTAAPTFPYGRAKLFRRRLNVYAIFVYAISGEGPKGGPKGGRLCMIKTAASARGS